MGHHLASACFTCLKPGDVVVPFFHHWIWNHLPTWHPVNLVKASAGQRFHTTWGQFGILIF